MFICMPNTNFIIYFFLEILHSSIWLGFWLTWESEFCQIWDWWWNVKTITISFHFRLIPEKTKAKIFWKLQNTLFWAHFCPFCPTWVKINFPGKKALSVFKYSHYLLSCKKLEKTNDPFIPEKNAELTDGQTDRQTDRKQWLYRPFC